MKLGNDEIALAMELRTEGICWKLIAWGLGCDTEHLINTVKKAKREGMK